MKLKTYTPTQKYLVDDLELSRSFINGVVSASIEDEVYRDVIKLLEDIDYVVEGEVIDKEGTIKIILEEEIQIGKRDWETEKVGELILYRSESGRFNGAEFSYYGDG